MLRSVLSRLPFVQTDQDDRDEESTGYLPSQMDASVLLAHGVGTEQVEEADSRGDDLDAVHDW